MIEYENECIGCPPEIGCIGSTCPFTRVPHYYCDNCKEEVDELFDVDGEELCEECLKARFRKVGIDDD